ncbi:polymer-forming cytoskeletal protein [Luteolibacter algae]|uniref:Polymer-forming cytoskeletal protein n=1 Tax=Luteolibacter algae TaxID=454151 RepID=A0ABW5D8F9_9BACT
MFKKVIGQEASESNKPSLTTPEERAPQPAAPTPSREAPASSYSAPAAPQSSPSARPASGNTRNVLSSDVEIKGTVKFQHDLIVDGKIEGDIQSTGNLTVGENARLKAEIKTGTVIVYGKVHGNMTATDRVELKSSAEVVGDIKAKTLTIEAGAIFVGKSTVGTPSQASAADSKPAQASQQAQPAK